MLPTHSDVCLGPTTAMGAGASSPEDGGADVVGKEQGFRVHRVEPNSPGYDAGLESIIDYIVVANGVRLDSDDGSFVRMISESKGKEQSSRNSSKSMIWTRTLPWTPKALSRRKE